MDFILYSFVYDTVWTAECLTQIVGIFKRSIKTFCWNGGSYVRKLTECQRALPQFVFPSKTIFNRKGFCDSKNDILK